MCTRGGYISTQETNRAFPKCVVQKQRRKSGRVHEGELGHMRGKDGGAGQH